MSTPDIVLVGVMLLGALRGFSRGLVRQVVSLAAFPIALPIAGRYNADLATVLNGRFGQQIPALGTPVFAQAVAFILAFLALLLLANLAGEILHRILVHGFVGPLNRAGGLALGLAETTLLVLIALLLLSVLSPALLAGLAGQAAIARDLLPYARMLRDLLPNDLGPTAPIVPLRF